MKRLLYITVLFTFFSLSHGQAPVGTWTDHLVYNTARNVAVSDKNVYASTGYSILVYNKEFAELKKLSHVNGLSETGISSIAWSDENEALVIAYSSANVDLVINNIVYNIPDISRKYIPGKKVINRIRIKGKYAYLICSFGIVVADIAKKEIYDTWKPGPGAEQNETWDIAFTTDKIYAATEAGLYTADITNTGLSYFGNWRLARPGNFNSVLSAGNLICANRSIPTGDSLIITGTGISLISIQPGINNVSLDGNRDASGFTVSSVASVRRFGNDGILKETISTYGSASPSALQAIDEKGTVWIADINSGLVRYSGQSGITRLTLPGPASNDVFHVWADRGMALLSGGGVNVAWTNIDKPFQVSVFKENKWSVLTTNTALDAMRAVADPADNNHIFVATWGHGLLEFENNTLKNQFTYTNSPLQTIIPNQPYVRMSGLAFDKKGNLWMTHSEVSGSIKVLKPDNNWIVNPLSIETVRVSDIIITRSGLKWVVLPRGPGIFVFDDNNTPEIFTDDRTKLLIIKDTENKIITVAHTVAEDLEGNIWIGTDEGPLVYYYPERVFNEDIRASRLKAPRNDGSGFADIVLLTESIHAIAVDGADRKWIGTTSSGAYLLSADGLSVVRQFTGDNSPLLSDNIISLACDNTTGTVWFVTSKGVVSYRGDAPQGEESFSDVYAFPNPVRQNFTGNVTIRGLVRDTRVTITDISGNLVYTTESKGGEASWDLTTYNGRRVATGVYLIFCASTEGKESTVTKVLVIR